MIRFRYWLSISSACTYYTVVTLIPAVVDTCDTILCAHSLLEPTEVISRLMSSPSSEVSTRHFFHDLDIERTTR